MGKEIDGRTGKNEGVPSKKCPKSDPKRGKTRKKWTSQGKKRARSLEKVPEIESKTGKSAKNGDFGAKKEGWGSGEKWALLPILQCYEVAKWVQMKFSRIFFVEVLQGMQKCPTFALAIGKQRSCKRGLRSESAEAAKALL